MNTEDKDMILGIFESDLQEVPPIVQELMSRCLSEIEIRDNNYTALHSSWRKARS